ncbi:MAG: hypothetical protein KKB05_01695 [Proteobacteria bacterium]|nr:hypothetical protein [Pseudomonadota bacterium]MBU4462641.1 hypothetical protein [Pseudomonadota bacterium]
MQEYTIHPLAVGINETDQGVMTYLRDYGKRILLHPIDHRYYSDVLDDVNVIEVDGDANIFDGIDVIFTPGHTVGGQSISINTSNGKAIITGFCCNEKNFPANGPAVASGVHINVMEAYDSAQKIKKMADILIPLHDLSTGRVRSIP